MNEPKISIVTPSLNQAHFIEDAIASVASQGYPYFEHIIVDGGSEDGTLDILKRSRHLVWFSERDRGQSDALNKGFKRASGEIIGWLNADDIYMPNAVQTVVDFFLAHPNVAMVYGFVNIVDESGDVLRTRYSPDFDLGLLVRGGHCYIQPVTFFRREVFEEVGYLDIELHEAMDFEFFIRVGQKLKIKRIPKILGNFRTHSRSKTFSGQMSERGLRERNEILNRYAPLGESDYPEVFMSLRDQVIMMFYRYYGGLRSLPKLIGYRLKHL
jgi:glycosyltransferase involved in cell wall biosynthesis